MTNKEIAKIFTGFADIYEILEDELKTHDKTIHFKIRAYRQGSMAVENLSKDLKSLHQQGQDLSKLPGIGQAMSNKIKEYIETGKVKEYEELKKQIPAGLVELLEIPGLGPKKVKLFYNSLGITNQEDLITNIKSGAVEALPRMGKKSAEKILDSIERIKNRPKRFLLGLALKEIEQAIKYLKESPACQQIDYAGSARRQKATVGDIDLLTTTLDADTLHQHFIKYPEIDEIIAEGETKISAYLKSGIQIDLRIVPPESFGAAMQYFTGSKEHNVALRTFAVKKGYKINEYGIYKGEKLVGGKLESDIYDVLNMQTPPPEIRQNIGELELALSDKLPQLITTNDLKGDLHIHSTYSDGKHEIREIAERAIEMGYEYIAITDHSPSLKVAHGVELPELKKKQAEIQKLNQELKITILFGTEVDILADGSIDYPNEILKEFDLVIASVHSGLNKDNTERIIKAMENPYVDIIGHPSTRLLNKRDGSPNDWEKIFKAAAKTKTILEINANPMRLDLDGLHVREANQLGCKFIINTDTHALDNLNFIPLGVGQARRGFLETKNVINTYKLAKFLSSLKRNQN